MPRRISVQRVLAERLLQDMPLISSAEFCRRCSGIRRSDPIEGSFALAWLFTKIGRGVPERERLDKAIEDLLRDGRGMKKIQVANKQWGMSPRDVVHYSTPKQIPRYFSEPLLVKF